MHPSRRPVAAVLAAAMLFGTAGTAQELGPEGTTPLGVGAVRIAVGAVTLWLVVLLRPGVAPRSGITTALRAQRRAVLVGAAGVAVYTPFFLAAVSRSGVAVATVVAISAGPLFTGALEWAVRNHRPMLAWLVGTVVTISGAVLLVGSVDTPDKQVDVVGLGFALLAGLGYAVYSVTAKSAMDAGMDPTLALAAPFTVGAVVLVLASVAEPYAWLTSASGATMALHLGVLATGAAYVLFAFGLDRLTAATTVTLVLAEPVTAVILASVLLDEAIAPSGWAGVAVVLAGLAVVGRSAEPDATPFSPF